MNHSGLPFAALLAVLSAGPLSAQGSSGLLARGIQAYQNLEFETASDLLRQSLNPSTRDARSRADSVQALSYLGATEFFRRRLDGARAAFQELILLEPEYRLDNLVFPPELSGFFDAVRHGTPAVGADLAPRTIAFGEERYAFRLYGSTPHEIDVVLNRENGSLVRRLYDGQIADSLVVEWDGKDGSGDPVNGNLVLFVVSRVANGAPERRLRVPLATTLLLADTLDHPDPLPESALLPESSRSGPAVAPLVTSLVAGAATIVLPMAIGSGDRGASPARFAVAGAVSLTGIAAMFSQRRAEPNQANIIANRARRDAWSRERAQALEENARRRRDVRLRIVPGPVSQKGGRA